MSIATQNRLESRIPAGSELAPGRGSSPGEQGVGLVITLLVLAIVSAIGTAILAGNMADLEISNNFGNRSVAFYAADSGVDVVVRDLTADPTWIMALVDPFTWQVRDPMPGSLTINGTSMLPQGGSFVAGQYHTFGSSVQLGDGVYSRQVLLPPVANVVAGDGTVTFEVRAEGRGGEFDRSTQVVRAGIEVAIKGYGVWDNAIFAGQGAAGGLINGNVAVRGSVHIVGDPNNPPTIDFSGTADIRNNYATAVTDFGATDAAKLPSLVPVEFNGETVESLEAVVRLEHGTITMDGSSDIGEADVTGNGYKETIDAVRTDGTVGPEAQVHADDWDDYDATGVEFPTLDDPYVDPSSGTYWNSHREFLENTSLLIPETEISADIAAFSYTDGNNSIAWDPSTGVLDIEGIIRVDRDLRFGKGHGRSNYIDIHYQGTGTIYIPNDLEIDAAVVPAGNYLADGNLGLIADESVVIDKLSQINVIAAIYAEETVRISKQTTLGGAVVSNYFDLGTNVPAIYQVPDLSTNLPPGMPGSLRLAVIDGASVINWFHER